VPERPPAPAGGRAAGILGGTFNPPHVGHLAVARHALDQLALDSVALMPAHASPHKHGGFDPGPEHRLAMCRLAVAGAPALEVCTLEIERGGVSYTVDTLKQIHAEHPDLAPTLILGADTALTLASWREPAQLLALADVAVAARPGTERGAVSDALTAIAPERPARFLEMPAVDVSSSQVRARVAAGEPIDGLVPDAVGAYIAEHDLYREAQD
jgi:nicotinate-nucleotide adenylyltransferase